MNRLPGIIRSLVRFGDRGGGTYHAISNQIWLWNIALTLAMIPLIGVLFVLYGELLAERRWIYLISYISVPVGIAALQAGLFWWGNASPPGPLSIPRRGGERESVATEKTVLAPPSTSWRGAGGEAARRPLALHLLIFSDCAMIWLFSLLIGAAGGIHFIFPAALALPFYFFRREIQARAWVIKGIWVSVIIGQFVLALWILPDVAAWRQLPRQVTEIARVIIVALAALIAVIWLVYFWWQLGLTRRFLNWWDKISLHGISVAQSADEREWLILANRLIYGASLYFALLFPCSILAALGHLFIENENPDRMRRLLTWFIPPVLFSVLFSITAAILFWRNALTWTQHQKQLFAHAYLMAASGIWLWGSILLPMSIPFYFNTLYGLLTLVLLPELGRSTKIRKVLIIFAWLCLVYAYVHVNLWGPPEPIPTYIVAWGRHVMHFVIFSSVLFVTYYIRHESNKSKSALNAEREKNAELHQQSEKLLLNILPAEVSHELKAHGHTTPREYPSATVLFTDFVGFTRIAEKLTAVDLVRELDQCFSYFDNVAQKYGLEKLKTIGDAYMAAGGIPVENNTHPIDCALAALEIQSFMNQMKDIKEQQGFPYWELRLGMHTGPLVAGVVGEKKFAYDVWGDTVNTASRMESSGAPGAINISRELYDQLRFLFACEYRGKVYAKNKGEIEMYFLRGLKPKFSIDGAGRVPNTEFKNIYEKIQRGARLVPKAK